MNQLCRVCGEPAAGFHFGAFTCEGCKSFFGRTYNNLGSISECKNQGTCVINKKNRTSCKACRLRKCLMVGMSKSGSRYGRRSNWFKIHCLLQEQQHQQQQRQQEAGVAGAPGGADRERERERFAMDHESFRARTSSPEKSPNHKSGPPMSLPVPPHGKPEDVLFGGGVFPGVLWAGVGRPPLSGSLHPGGFPPPHPPHLPLPFLGAPGVPFLSPFNGGPLFPGPLPPRCAPGPGPDWPPISAAVAARLTAPTSVTSPMSSPGSVSPPRSPRSPPRAPARPAPAPRRSPSSPGSPPPRRRPSTGLPNDQDQPMDLSRTAPRSAPQPQVVRDRTQDNGKSTPDETLPGNVGNGPVARDKEAERPGRGGSVSRDAWRAEDEDEDGDEESDSGVSERGGDIQVSPVGNKDGERGGRDGSGDVSESTTPAPPGGGGPVGPGGPGGACLVTAAAPIVRPPPSPLDLSSRA